MEVNGVEFEEEGQDFIQRPSFEKKKRSISAWLIKHKIAKDPIQANMQLVYVLIISVIVSVGALYFNSLHPSGPTHSQEIRWLQMGRLTPRSQ